MLCRQVKTENESFSAILHGCAATVDYTHTYFGSEGLGRGSTAALDLQSTSLVSRAYVVYSSCEWLRIITEFMNEVFFGLRRNMDRSCGVVRLVNPRALERST